MMARRLVADAFGRAADYDAHADVQREVAAMLARQIAAEGCAPAPRILEIGCGTGLLGAALMPLLGDARWVMSDLSPAMLGRARARFAGREDILFHAMDGQAPDLAGPFDLICSSLAFQWFGDLASALARLEGLLAPGGMLAFSTLVSGSFREWREAHGDWPCGAPDYPGEAELRDMGLKLHVVDLPVDGGGRAFLRHLRGIGASVPRDDHRPLTPGQLKQVIARFDAGGGRATYRVALCMKRAAG